MDHVDPLALELPRAPEAPAIARQQLARSFGGALRADQLQTVRLLTSELVTNALLHGAGSIVLRASLEEHRLLVEVIDEGNGLDSRAPIRPDPDHIGGYGLQIVDSEASRWGIGRGTTHVWFELEC
ncbi:MAG TPA: ATP-binding protein [Solirubrobacteraceae bacterium]|nr:ATP-binding protein [Solirubrobacteraceae bacterium]